MNDERVKQAAHLADLNDELIAEKLLIEGQRDLIQNILESAHEGMMMCDSEGTILFANHRMSRYFGLNKRIGEIWWLAATRSLLKRRAFSELLLPSKR